MKIRITGAGEPVQEIRWVLGKPSESGYYLAAWETQAKSKIVSELWFNDGDGRGTWWASRGYLETFGGPAPFLRRPIETVFAWCDLPDAPDRVHWRDDGTLR